MREKLTVGRFDAKTYYRGQVINVSGGEKDGVRIVTHVNYRTGEITLRLPWYQMVWEWLKWLVRL